MVIVNNNETLFNSQENEVFISIPEAKVHDVSGEDEIKAFGEAQKI